MILQIRGIGTTFKAREQRQRVQIVQRLYRLWKCLFVPGSKEIQLTTGVSKNNPLQHKLSYVPTRTPT